MTKEGFIFSSMCILGISTAFCGHPVSLILNSYQSYQIIKL